MIENNTNYSLEKGDDTKGYREYSLHYGWNKLTHYILKQLPQHRVIEASLNDNREVIINNTGSRIASNDNTSVEGSNHMILIGYQQMYYLYCNDFV